LIKDMRTQTKVLSDTQEKDQFVREFTKLIEKSRLDDKVNIEWVIYWETSRSIPDLPKPNQFCGHALGTGEGYGED
jgi:hypothetical protein